MLAPVLDRLETERRFHDEQASSRRETFDDDPARLRFDDAAYLDHETWIRPAFSELGDLAGKRVLDCGCGHGMASVVLARAGARVSAFDLSPGYVAEAERRAEANRVAIEFRTADAECLPYSDESFDAAWGHAILHHLDLAKAGTELHRVLKPGGVAVFCEPWGGNPLLAAARRWLPYPGKHRTPDERPLTATDVAVLRSIFPNVKVTGHQLTGMIRRVWKAKFVSAATAAFDRGLLAICPPLWHWCRYAVVVLRR